MLQHSVILPKSDLVAILRNHEFNMHQIKKKISCNKKCLVTKRSYKAAFGSTANNPTPAKSLVVKIPRLFHDSSPHPSSIGVLIPAIRTFAWKKHQKNNIVFAILMLPNVIPIIVRVYECGNGQSLLCTATEADFQACRNDKGQPSVPIVASVTRVLEANGKVSWSVKPPKHMVLRLGRAVVEAIPNSPTALAQYVYEDLPECENIADVVASDANGSSTTVMLFYQFTIIYLLKSCRNSLTARAN